MLYIGYLIIVNGPKIKKIEKYPFLSNTGWKTTSAVCAHITCH